MIVWLKNTGNISFKGSFAKNTGPNGTSSILNFGASYYDSHGNYICGSGSCLGVTVDDSGGGYLKFVFDVAGFVAGDHLVLTYTVVANGLTAGPQSYWFYVG